MSTSDEKHEDFQHLEVDEKRGVEAEYTVDPDVARRIRRKFDLHILPWIFLLWLLSNLDRSNIGNAKLDGLVTELNLTGTNFNVALAVFYILFIVVDMPSNLVLKYVGGGRYIPLMAMAWGIVVTCIGAVKTYGGLIACRLFLGMCEGGMFGGVIFYLSMFYKRHDLMFRLGIYYSATPLSSAFGGLLATGLAQIKFHGFNGWPWIFFVEGAITVIASMAAFFFLPNTPGSARFLTEEERRAATHLLNIDLHGGATKDYVEDEKFSWSAARFSILNVNTILLAINFFLILIPVYSFSLFLPTIISGLGFTAVDAQLLTAPPNVLGFLTVIIVGFFSDRIKARGPFIAALFVVAAIGYIMQLASDRSGVKYAGTFFIAAGAFPCPPLVLGWLANNLAPQYAKATGLGFQVAFGNCSAFLATFTYLTQDAPKYTVGHAINLGAIGLGLIVTSVTIAYIRWENAARASGKRDHRLREGNPAELGYRHPEFRYTL